MVVELGWLGVGAGVEEKTGEAVKAMEVEWGPRRSR